MESVHPSAAAAARSAEDFAFGSFGSSETGPTQGRSGIGNTSRSAVVGSDTGLSAPELDQLLRPNADKRLVRLDSGPSPHEPGAEVGEPRAIHLDGPACTHLPRHETRVRKEPDR